MFADFVEALPDAALLIDATGLVAAANALARDVLQLEPVGLAATSVIRNAGFAAALGTVRSGKAAVTFDLDMHSRLSRQFSVHIAPVGAGGDILALLRDLTREQRIEKMRSDFVANVSHEMRTPLASIMGAVETLQGAAKNDPEARTKFLDSMLTQANRMRRLIDDLLTLSRIELSEHVRPNARIDLTQIVQQAKDNLRDLAKTLSVAVALETQGPVTVAGDGDELLQVVQNLLENAIKYGSAGGRVELKCQAENGQAVLKVVDFGKGIAEVHLPRLTERFYRVSTQESRARGGTGLGLAIVKHIVSRHRGRLDIASQIDQGSTFTVTFPLLKS